MKIFLGILLTAATFSVCATTPDIGGVREVVIEASVIVKAEIKTKTEDNQCNPHRHNRYKGKVLRIYKLFGTLEDDISFCTDVDLDKGKQYVIALFCEHASRPGYVMSATVDSIFYKDVDNKFRRRLPAELRELLPADADPRLEEIGFEEIISNQMIEAAEIRQCHVDPQ